MRMTPAACPRRGIGLRSTSRKASCVIRRLFWRRAKKRPAPPSPNSQGELEGRFEPAVPLVQRCSPETAANPTAPQNPTPASQPPGGRRGEETPMESPG